MASKCVSGVCSADIETTRGGKQKCRPNANNGLEKDMTWIVNTMHGSKLAPRKCFSSGGYSYTCCPESKAKAGEE